MLERGVAVSYETIRLWCAKFGRPTPASCDDGGPGSVTHGTSRRASSDQRQTDWAS